MLFIGIGLVGRRYWATRQARIWGIMGIALCGLLAVLGLFGWWASSNSIASLLPFLMMILVLFSMPLLMVVFFKKARVATWELFR